MLSIKRQLFKRRMRRVRARITGTAERPRLAVFRSLKHISGQLINDEIGRVIVSVYDNKISKSDLADVKKNQGLTGKMAPAYVSGAKLGELAVKKGLKKIIFDRRGYKYHGRVKVFADGARASGLEF